MGTNESNIEVNKKIVREQIAAMERGDAAAQGLLMTDDVQWWFPQSAVETTNLPLERLDRLRLPAVAMVGQPLLRLLDVEAAVFDEFRREEKHGGALQ